MEYAALSAVVAGVFAFAARWAVARLEKNHDERWNRMEKLQDERWTKFDKKLDKLFDIGERNVERIHRVEIDVAELKAVKKHHANGAIHEG